MSVQQNIKDKEYVSQKGNEIYNQSVLPTLDIDEMKGKIVAIDIDSGEHTIAETTLEAGNRMFQKHPQARILYKRIGFPYMRRMATMVNYS